VARERQRHTAVQALAQKGSTIDLAMVYRWHAWKVMPLRLRSQQSAAGIDRGVSLFNRRRPFAVIGPTSGGVDCVVLGVDSVPDGRIVAAPDRNQYMRHQSSLLFGDCNGCSIALSKAEA
jgi:hypothetical protein